MAQITDEAIRARTGKDWRSWFEILDRAGAAEMNHKEIVALLRDNHDLSPWWQQSVTVEYEKARGLRQKHEKSDGYQIGASRTMNVPVQAAYHAWASDRERLDWLPQDHLIITTKNREKTIRGTWAGGPTRLDVYFTPRETNRVQVTVNHSKLPDSKAAEDMKVFWRITLARLQEYLERT